MSITQEGFDTEINFVKGNAALDGERGFLKEAWQELSKKQYYSFSNAKDRAKFGEWAGGEGGESLFVQM